MENIEIPDDFYIYTSVCGYKYLCHKSCIFVNSSFSNCKFQLLRCRSFSDEDIAILRYKCNIIDEIEEKTYFVDTKFNDLCYYVHDNTSIYLHGTHYVQSLSNIKDFLEYLDKKYPECIRNNDIKIALKD
jgi:hypothetical protein